MHLTATPHKLTIDTEEYPVLELHTGEPTQEVGDILESSRIVANALDITEAVAFGVRLAGVIPKGERVFCMQKEGVVAVSHTGEPNRQAVEELVGRDTYKTVRVCP